MVNADSGEIADYHVLDEESGGFPVKKKPTGHGEPWMTLFNAGIFHAAQQTDLSGTDYRVLLANWLLPSNTDEGWHVDHRKVARIIGASESQVLASTAKLVRRGLLTKPRRGYLHHHPLFSWRGTTTSRTEAKKAYLAEREAARKELECPSPASASSKPSAMPAMLASG